MRIPATFLIFIAGLLISGTLRAATDSPDTPFSCADAQPTDMPTSAIRTAQINGSSRAFFIKNEPGCVAGGASCQTKAYVVPGDTVLTAQTRGNDVCVFFPNRKDGYTGWLPRNRLSPVIDTPPLQAWAGRWIQEDNVITITDHGHMLSADGQAYYPMANPPPDQFPGGPDLGAMGGNARPDGHKVTFTDEDCSVTAILAGKFLVVSDNHQCGGMNVRFVGVYQRP